MAFRRDWGWVEFGSGTKTMSRRRRDIMGFSMLEAARQAVRNANRIAVLTGAGVSAESGIPTFRSNGGFWQNRRFEDLATPQGFARDPKFVWQWYEERRRGIAAARPNAGHIALVAIERRVTLGEGEFALITQNVDGLHDLAGSRNIIKLHGDIWTVRCTVCHAERIERAELNDLPPHCACGGLLRPGVVWFGEALPEGAIEQASRAISRADVLIVAGTSAQVYPAAGLIPLALGNGARVIEINPETTGFSADVTFALRENSAAVLPELI
jgi:NAD-dependent deacetylase